MGLLLAFSQSDMQPTENFENVISKLIKKYVIIRLNCVWLYGKVLKMLIYKKHVQFRLIITLPSLLFKSTNSNCTVICGDDFNAGYMDWDYTVHKYSRD